MQITTEDLPESSGQHDRPAPTQLATSHDSVEHLAIASRFNIDTPSKEENEKLQTVWEWVKSQKDERPMSDVIWEVIHLEQTLGAPKIGESRLDKLYKYVRLRIGEARIQEELKNTVL